jgi:hypothetical protein
MLILKSIPNFGRSFAKPVDVRILKVFAHAKTARTEMGRAALQRV